jgi:Protein kinase domain
MVGVSILIRGTETPNLSTHRHRRRLRHPHHIRIPLSLSCTQLVNHTVSLSVSPSRPIVLGFLSPRIKPERRSFRRGKFGRRKAGLLFSSTKVILKCGDDYFYARTSLRLTSQIDVSKLDPVLIPIEHLRPLYSADWTRAATPLPDDVYVKVTSLLHCEADIEPPLSALVLAEARTNRLKYAPPESPIIGCLTQDNRITGLCFARYKKTLDNRLADPDDMVEREVTIDIRRGIEHLHCLGITHNDINPYNIMFKPDGTAVIIDFDSCAHVGEKLLKGGGWEDQVYSDASPTYDYTALKKIEDIIESQWTTKCRG